MNPLEQKSQIIIYQTEDGRTKIDVRLENEALPQIRGHFNHIRVI